MVAEVCSAGGRPLIPPPENFSNWQLLLMNTAVAAAFPRVLIKKRIRGPVSTHEVEEARVMILRWVQTDLHSLNKGYLATLSHFQDENDCLWRTARASFLSYDERFPVTKVGQWLRRWRRYHHANWPLIAPHLPIAKWTSVG